MSAGLWQAAFAYSGHAIESKPRMNVFSLLIVCIALCPTVLAVRVWLLATRTGDDLSGYRHYGRFDD